MSLQKPIKWFDFVATKWELTVTIFGVAFSIQAKKPAIIISIDLLWVSL